MVTVSSLSASRRAWAAARASAAAFSSSARRASNLATFSGVAAVALPWGIR